ncbi:MAG: 16S rRNA (uracil(1498)-N(3))-methyltransferase [Bacteroidales bacterium]|nr:16S rRNA (uracil(1498)-N(3))-methyltransferase [Anaerotignum sp.]MCI5679043.1 16S rRNA (uracil(1498)-N(3))-methyltransferase [Bacteroidales bacterium]MDY3927594.1 16S rRNA (uracil(1498)-N(3))-methyltransferase [Anaerotignum sp.]
MPKFFFNKNDISRGQVQLFGEDEKHIKTVLRAREGEELTLCDGEGMDYQCRIASLERGVLLDILSKVVCETEPRTKITLYQGLPKADKMELIIQKCVELGVDRIVAVSTERAIVKLDKKESKKLERWQKIAEAAAKQSGRGKIPEIGQQVLKFKEAVAEAKELDGAIIPYEKEQETGIRQFVQGFRGESIGVFIGPEGGFAEEEIALAQENGITPITLGKRILRTETAGMTTAAILLYELD